MAKMYKSLARTVLILSVFWIYYSALAKEAELASIDVATRIFYVSELRLTVQKQDLSEADYKLLAAHGTYHRSLYELGVLVMSGPYMDTPSVNGLVVLDVPSLDAARAVLRNDPAVQAGLMELGELKQWWRAFNRAEGIAVENSQSGLPAAGSIVFLELGCYEVEPLVEFYSLLFGWKCDYTSEYSAQFDTPGGLSGAFNDDYTPAANGPLIYLAVDSVQRKLEQIIGRGGTELLSPIELPGAAGWICHFRDPAGNRLGLWSQNP